MSNMKIPSSCPYIDSALSEAVNLLDLVDITVDNKYWAKIHYAQIENDLENTREVNTRLRDFATAESERAKVLADRVDELENELLLLKEKYELNS